MVTQTFTPTEFLCFSGYGYWSSPFVPWHERTKRCPVNPLGSRSVSSCLLLCSYNHTSHQWDTSLYTSIVSPKGPLAVSHLHPMPVQYKGSVWVHFSNSEGPCHLQSSSGCLRSDCTVTHLLPWFSSDSFHKGSILRALTNMFPAC